MKLALLRATAGVENEVDAWYTVSVGARDLARRPVQPIDSQGGGHNDKVGYLQGFCSLHETCPSKLASKIYEE